MKKSDLINLLETMPDEIDPDELMYRVYLVLKLEAAEADLAAGRTLAHEEVVRLTDQWLK